MSLRDLGVLQVEPTDMCNLRCAMCAPHFEQWDTIHGIPKGYLDVSLWESIVEGFLRDNLRFDHIIFQWLGDPLLHPQIIELISIATSKLSHAVQYVRMDTNAIVLTQEKIEALCSIAVHSKIPILLVCSIDAHTPSVYKKVKGADMLLLVRKNIKRFLEERARYGATCFVNIQIQFVVQQENAHEAHSFLLYWKNIFDAWGGFWHDELMFKRLSVGGGAEGQAAADLTYERSITQTGISPQKIGNLHILCWEQRPWQNDDAHHAPRSACPALWMTPVIRHDGSLMVCCADLQGELTLGSLRDKSFSQLWFGAYAQKLRNDHLLGHFNGVCKSCGGINWYTLTQQKQQLLHTYEQHLKQEGGST